MRLLAATIFILAIAASSDARAGGDAPTTEPARGPIQQAVDLLDQGKPRQAAAKLAEPTSPRSTSSGRPTTATSRPSEFEAHLAQDKPAEGTREIHLSESDGIEKSIFVFPKAVLDASAISKARKIAIPHGAFALELTLNKRGSHRLFEVTRYNIGRHLAFFVNGELISIPKIVTIIRGGQVFIRGSTRGFTLQEADKLVSILNKTASTKPSSTQP